LTTATRKLTVTLRSTEGHPEQHAFVVSRKPRKVIRAGRRGGKTTGVARLASDYFLEGWRVLYGAPTTEQVGRFWFEIKQAFHELTEAGVFAKNESEHFIERPGTEQRIRAKTAWNADTLRGDYADLLILDEYQLMSEDAWGVVGAPMLLDNNGHAVFVYTPPSLHSKSTTKARDPLHAPKLFKRAQADTTGRWETFHFKSADNPFISHEAIEEIAGDMTSLAYRQEILAEDVDEVPGALWSRELVETQRIVAVPDEVELTRVVVGVDPPGGATECGIVVAARGSDGNGYVLADDSVKTTPAGWGHRVVAAYEDNSADRVIGEANYGGDMVESTIRGVARDEGMSVSYTSVQATRGKAVRAEPVAALYEKGHVFHVGSFPALEEEMVSYVPGESSKSPNRMDALVWALTHLIVKPRQPRVRWVG